ncbi:MAG: hypothetical protein AB7F35_10625 [Acetobacteraceae bacterium]
MFGIKTKRRAAAADLTTFVPQAAPSRIRYNLDQPLLSLTGKDRWTMRDAFQGTCIMGGTGSGKTSGSGRAIAHAFLRAGFGGLVLCAKPGERQQWQQYANETGRERSLIVFDASGQRRFNWLDYEMRRGDRLVTHNLVMLFMRIMEAAKGRDGAGQGGNDQFWQDAVQELLSNAFLVLYSAWGSVTLADLMALLMSAPGSLEEGRDPEWRERSFCFESLEKMVKDPVFPLTQNDAVVAGRYFQRRWPTLSDRTKSSVELHLTSLISPFLTGYLNEIFCTDTNIIPEFTHEGAVIVVDLPIKEHGDAGLLAAHVWKYLWQRAAERRNAEGNPLARPLFLWADECQFFVSKYDGEFQSTARSSKAATVYLTQSLPAFYERIGTRTVEHSTHALINNFQTRIFHQNLDATTNHHAADLIGRNWFTIRSWGSNRGGSTSSGETVGITQGGSYSSNGRDPGTSTSSWGWSKSRSYNESHSWGTSENYTQQVEHEVLPSTFTRLRQGGRDGYPQAIVVQGGRMWKHNKRAYLLCEFPQS